MRQSVLAKNTAQHGFMQRVRRLMPYLFLLMVLGSCNDEDDVTEIFTGKTWKLTYIGSTDDWTDLSSGVNLNNYLEEKQPQNAYTVIFYDGSVRITGGEATVWTGTWSADGKSNTFHITITDKQGEGTTANEKTFLELIAGACYYRGSSVLLRLFDSDRANFAQFSPLGT